MINKCLVMVGLLLCLGVPSAMAQTTVPSPQEKLALMKIDTTMWKYLAASDRAQWNISASDSETAIRNHFFPGYNNFKVVTEIYDRIGKKKTTLEQESQTLIKLLEQARDHFESGLKIDPFNNYLRLAITSTYSYLEKLYASQNEPIKRLAILLNLLRLRKEPKESVYLSNNIGLIYRQFEMWEMAKSYFHRAVETILDVEEAPVDTLRLFENLYLRGDAQFHLYEAEGALTSFTYARMIAPNQTYYNQLTARIDFINWDDGNIRASEKYNEAKGLYNNKKYNEAELAYLELLGMVTSERATNEANLALTRMQFYQMNKKEEAIERLWNLVRNYALDPATGKPINKDYEELWREYSQMCVFMGVKYYNTDKRTSFTYFLKASQIEGPLRGQALLNLARASIQNPQICLNYCLRALDFEDRLDPEEKRYLYQTIYQAYLQQGDFDHALIWFKNFHDLAS
ncbi:MAG: hypothetical protein ONB32_13905 [candidate division KSB1 bacterium]|nr:hypothetical protein [candidate division KSB1 bacterium]